MLTLYKMLPVWGLPSPSPPCMKLEAWLRMTNIPYEVGGFDMTRAPKRKVPYVDDDGALLGDSTFILEHLERTRDVHPDAHLSASARAVATAFRRMMKENTYFVTVHIRWAGDDSWARTRLAFADQFPSALPLEQRLGILDSLRPGMLAVLDAQGMGRHTPEEVCQIGQVDLTAVRDYLGDKPYMMGDRVSTVDATVFAHVDNILRSDVESPLIDWAREQSTLVAYCDRLRAAYFPELSAAS
ncbi:MAG: glutathione S-transferase family protein [Myxococcales bacterium]|nr:glutathione S-transferase family protein [Myxococcales bacterium]MCB9751037.1 glutathione S-transferase family protein [Myxococcales bacterium]